MLRFSDSRRPNVLIAAIGSYVLFLSSLVSYAFFLKSSWVTYPPLLVAMKVMYGMINATAVTMSLYALVISYQNGWLSESRLGRVVLSSAPYPLLFWCWKLYKIIKELL
jgi:hypothetical protein